MIRQTGFKHFVQLSVGRAMKVASSPRLLLCWAVIRRWLLSSVSIRLQTSPGAPPKKTDVDFWSKKWKNWLFSCNKWFLLVAPEFSYQRFNFRNVVTLFDLSLISCLHDAASCMHYNHRLFLMKHGNGSEILCGEPLKRRKRKDPLLRPYPSLISRIFGQIRFYYYHTIQFLPLVEAHH